MTTRNLVALAIVLALGMVSLALAAEKDFGPTLSAPQSPTTRPSADGFVQRWVILDPIAVTGLTDSLVQRIVKKQYFPNQQSVLPRDGETVSIDSSDYAWHAVDTKLYNINLYHLARSQGKRTSNVLFWCVTQVDSAVDQTNVRLAIGSNAASVWWVNDQELIGIYGDRQTVIDDGVSKRITLKKGRNVVRAAVVNGGGATDFCARFLDSDDKPITNLTISLPRAGN